MKPRKLKALVADDSSAHLRVLRACLSERPDVELTGTARSAEELLEFCRLSPSDLLFLALELGGENDFALLETIREEFPDLSVVILAEPEQASRAVRSLNRGAFDILQRSEDTDPSSLHEAVEAVLSQRRLRLVPEPARARQAPVVRPSGPEAPRERGFDLVLLACSTGGPNALRALVPALPGDLPAPVLAVQHLPQGYLPRMVTQLRGLSAVDVSISTNRMELPERGWVFARPGWHLEVRPNLLTGKGFYLKETTQDRVHGCRPAADVLFRSVATAFEGRVLSVVMTGMGRDGCDGVASLKEGGGYCLVQDQPTSVVYGMPRAVQEAGLADETLPLNRLAERIAELVGGGEA